MNSAHKYLSANSSAKDTYSSAVSVAQLVKRELFDFDMIDPSSSPPFVKRASPFPITYQIRKAFIFNKNKVNIWKVEIKRLINTCY